MNILAIDQSLTNSGIAISIGDHPLTYTSIKPPKGVRGVERLIYIERALTELIDDNSIDHLVMEGYAYGRVNGMAESGELGGVIKMLAFKKGLYLISLSPSSHKKFTTGAGNTKKELMLKNVYKSYDIDVDDNNIADAISLLKTYQGYLQEEKGVPFGIELTVKKREAIKAINKSLNK